MEVLRGPQGTLFGRNTSAGALNVVNKRPELDSFGGFVNASYGNFDEISVQGAVNVPIVQDTLALRLTGAYRERDGFITLVDGDGNPFDDSNDVDQYLVRAQLGFETESGLRGRLIGDFSNSTSSCCSPIQLYEAPIVTAGAFAAIGRDPAGGNGQPVTSTNPFGQPVFEEALDNRIASANFAPQADIDNYGFTGEVEFPISDSADLIFIGSYRKYESFERYDSDFTALDIFNVESGRLDLETWTAELRLQGEAFDGNLNYIFGAYYSDESIDQTVDFALGSDFEANFAAAFLGGAFGPTPFQTLTGATPGVGAVDPTGTTSRNRFRQDAKSYSIFTNNTFDITDGLSLTLGARYSWEDKEGDFTQEAVNNDICPATLASLDTIPLLGVPASQVPTLTNAFFALGCFGFTAPADLPAAQVLPLVRTFDTTFNDEELIYTVNLGYEFAAPVNVYASFTHGYKSGGINLDTTAAVAGAEPSFLSEEVDAYEVGLKSRLLDNAVTFNLAAFYEKFTNFQVLEFTGTAFQTFNVPKADTKGVEIETLIRPNSELTFNLSGTFLKASYPDDCAGDQVAPQVVSLCGYDLTNAPQIVAIAGGLWEKPINASTEFFLSGQVRMEGDQRTSTQAIVPPSADQIAALGVEAAVAAQPLIVGDIQDGKTFVNLRAGLRFADGAYSIEGFVNNLTDEVVRGVTFNTTLRNTGAGNARSAFSLQPRTYGVTVRARF